MFLVQISSKQSLKQLIYIETALLKSDYLLPAKPPAGHNPSLRLLIYFHAAIKLVNTFRLVFFSLLNTYNFFSMMDDKRSVLPMDQVLGLADRNDRMRLGK